MLFTCKGEIARYRNNYIGGALNVRKASLRQVVSL